MDFEIGDRICKVRGINSGKSGTIRSVLPNGTVGVVFDGEKTVRYCDPGNCAKPTMIPVATNASVKVRPEIQKEYDAYVKAKEKFDKWWNPNRRFSEGGRETRDLHEAEKALWTKWRAVFGTPIPSGWAGNPSVLANAKIEVDGSKLKFADKTGKWHGPFKNWDELEREMGKYGISLNSNTLNAQNTGVSAVRRITDKITAFLSNALDTNAKTSYADVLSGTNVIRISFDFSPHVDKDVYMKNESSIKTEIVRIVKTVIPKASPSVRWIASGNGIYRVECNFVYNDYKGSPQYVGTNAATDAEFEKIKAIGKTAGDKYFRDNYQSFIDKYGFKDALELGKRISRIKYKPIKKGRYSGKGPDGMTYYVDYTNDRWFAKKYGKDGTNVTAIQIQGPYVKDPDGKERRHILYLYGSGSESIHPANPAVAQLVKQIMRGPDVLKQDAADYAWNEDVKSINPVVANMKNTDGLSVGEKVKYRYIPGVDVDEIFKVIKDIDFQYVMIKRLSDGKEWKEFSHNLVPVRNSYSKNSVVANAIAWKARNAVDDQQWIKDAQDAIYSIRSGGFPRRAIEKFYSRYGRYTMDGLHRTGEVQKIAEELNDMKFDVETSQDARDKAVKLLYTVQRIKAPKE